MTDEEPKYKQVKSPDAPEDGQQDPNRAWIEVPSSRFGPLTVPADSIIEFPTGLIGFPAAKRFIMVEHKPPFSWLQSVDDQTLAFVVVDGFEFGKQLDLKPPTNDPHVSFKPEDEYAILLIVTIRPDPKQTTLNLKAPLFVSVETRKAVQVIYDDPRYSVRYPLWKDDEETPSEE
jgi:flagellar assembly factor FliW